METTHMTEEAEVAQILSDHQPFADGCTCGDIYPDEPHLGHLTALLANWHETCVAEAKANLERGRGI